MCIRTTGHSLQSCLRKLDQHILDKRFQMVRYYGWYPIKMRGQRRIAEHGER